MTSVSDPVGVGELTPRGRGALADRAFRWAAVLAGAVVLAVLALIAISTTNRAWPAFRIAGLDFITTSRWAPNDDAFGAVAFIYGTLVVSAIAVVLAVPISMGIALFTTEVVGPKLRTWITTVVDLLAAVPSVVYGLWGILMLAPNVQWIYDSISSGVSSVPVLNTIFREGASGRSYMTAGIIVALMIIPIITSITREVLTTVPRDEKDAALALGATKWEMIRGAVLPHSFGGIIGAVMLGLGRAMGETIAIALTIGSSIRMSGSLLDSGTALPEIIVLELPEASGNHRSALIGLGVVLFAMIIVVNMVARWVVNRAETAMRGAT